MRPVDTAMAEDRPAKESVRALWMDFVQRAQEDWDASDTPLYLTLPGRRGREIELLIERKILSTTPTGAIAEDDLRKVVAVEFDPAAEVELRRRYPGLKVIRQKIEELLRSTSPLTWPQGKDEDSCRAYVVNLDLSSQLAAIEVAGQLQFPVIQLITKFAELHAKLPVINWTLCLTLNGRISWSDSLASRIYELLLQNFNLEPEFASAARNFLGDELYGAVCSRAAIDWAARSSDQHQRLLMTLVPKKIAQSLHGRGWLVKTPVNLRYGSSGPSPMTTWILRLEWDPRGSTAPDSVYREGLRSVLDQVGQVEEDGSIS